MRDSHDFENLYIRPIAHIRTDFPEKFGIPRQGSLVKDLQGTILLEKEFQKDGILKELEGFSHIWLLWGFSESKSESWSPTVRPPRLGGEISVGIFACRSPHRPNPLGLTCVKLKSIDTDKFQIEVTGVDMKDGTPIYDIKPYLPFSDCIIEATTGFAEEDIPQLEVHIPDELISLIQADKLESLKSLLSYDPRPAYQKNSEKIYGMRFGNQNLHFQVHGHVLTVLDITPIPSES